MAESKSKTFKKVTKIPEASVTIEVEQTEEEAAASETIVKTEEAEVQAPMEVTEVKETHEEILPPINSSLDDLGDDSSSSFGWKKVFLFTTVAAIIGFLIVGAFLYVKGNYSLNLSKKEATKSIDVPAISPTPTPETVDKEAYKINVLNGSGISGEAAVVQKTLEDGGFTVSGIGNADSQSVTKTTIAATDKVSKEYVAELEKTLKERGPVEVIDADSDQTDDVVVIVGSSVNKSPTP